MQKIYAFWLVGVLLAGCTPTVGSANFNDHIDGDSRAKIAILNNRVIAAMRANSPAELKALFAPEALSNTAVELDGFVTATHSALTDSKFTPLDEYLIRGTATGATATVTKGTVGEYAYKLDYPAVTNETYLSLLLNDSKANRLLLTCVYGKYGEEWKLTALKAGTYSFFGKTAVDFLNQAKANYSAGNLMDAANDIAMVRSTAAPAGGIFHYHAEDAMGAFVTKVSAELSARFPLPKKMETLKTGPQVFNIAPVAMAEGIYPTVKYLTTISLTDTVALKKENEQLKAVIGTVFPGLDKNKKYVFFKAYNQIPDGKTEVKNYGFVLNNQPR